uniref:Paralemmin-1 n=1 Tax=Electrophorus electricus TaxID=8005 RepID=A0A4W4HN75_ELEEL
MVLVWDVQQSYRCQCEKRKRQAEIENKRRQLEDERRQLQHLKSKALRERWLLDGAPSAGSEEDEAKKQLQEDEAKTKGLEEAILRLEQELEELETGVSTTSTKESLSDAAHLPCLTDPNLTLSFTVVHEVRTVDGTVANGVHQLSSSEVEELIHKADEVTMKEDGTPAQEVEKVSKSEKPEVTPALAAVPAPVEITGVEAKPAVAAPPTEVGTASAENPVTMVFMGYQNVEDEDETKKVLGMESTTVTAELVVIEDGENKATASNAQEEQAPPNGGPAEPAKAQEVAADASLPEVASADISVKEKQPCKCCTIM